MIKVQHLSSNDNLAGLYQVKENISYGSDPAQYLSVVYPWATDFALEKPCLPLVVFVQGSGWTTPSLLFQLPQLCEFARKGYVVANVCHRSIFDGAPVPAQLEDVKLAIRYLRAHAAEFGIDTERVAIWGSSSGAQTAQTVGVTANMEQFKVGGYEDVSDAVSCVVSCFGPCDLGAWCETNKEDADCKGNIAILATGTEEERHEAFRAVSSLTYVNAERASEIPPFFLSVGTADAWVKLHQVTDMAEALDAVGVPVEEVIVDDAVHEATFWSQDVLDLVWDFLAKQLG